MDAVAQLGTEHVMDESVLSEPGHPCKRGRGYDRVEVMAVAGDVGRSAGDPGLYP
jgi:hypothetical protein